MKKLLAIISIIGAFNINAQTPTVYWQGAIDSLWNNPGNWSTNTVPSSNDSVIVDNANQHSLAITGSGSCLYLTIISTGKVVSYNGANLNVNSDLTIGLGAGGTLQMKDGDININRYLQTKRNSTFEISNGNLSFQEWVENYEEDLFYAKGNITLSGGNISGISVYFSNIDLTGVMDGPFLMELSGNLYTSENWTISDGDVLLTHTSWNGGIGFTVSPDGPNQIGRICNVTLDFPNTPDYHTSIPFEAEKMIVQGNLNIIRGTMKTHKNFWYNIILDTLEIQGDFIIGSGAKFDFDSTETVMNVKGDFTNNGNMNPSQGEVLFSGTDQSVIGNTTFNVFKKANQGLLKFESGSQQNINDLILNGTSSNNIVLRSSNEGDQWYFDLLDTWQVDYVDVKDGHKLNAPIVAPTNSIDSGNNTNWFSLNSIETENDLDLSFKVFPNPTSDVLTVSNGGPGEIKLISLYDSQGKLVINQDENNQQTTKLDLRRFKSGIYNLVIFYQVHDSNVQTAVQKRIIVKN